MVYQVAECILSATTGSHRLGRAANSEDENRILATQKPGEQLIVQLRGKVYRFE